MNWRKMFKEYDFFAKAMEDVTTQTFFGGLISVLTAILMILLVAFEFSRFMQTQWTSELIVDTSSNQEQMEIHFDISFPKIPCFGKS